MCLPKALPSPGIWHCCTIGARVLGRPRPVCGNRARVSLASQTIFSSVLDLP